MVYLQLNVREWLQKCRLVCYSSILPCVIVDRLGLFYIIISHSLTLFCSTSPCSYRKSNGHIIKLKGKHTSLAIYEQIHDKHIDLFVIEAHIQIKCSHISTFPIIQLAETFF